MSSLITKRAVVRIGNVALGLWLFVVLFAHAGVLKLKGLLADLATITVILVIATMIWKYALRPLVDLIRRRP